MRLSADSPMVAVGVPGGNVSGQNDAGWTGFFAAGLNDPRAVDQDSAGIPGAAEAGDRFGEAITLGLMAGTSSRVDAAVGTPGEDLGSERVRSPTRRVHHHQRSLHRSRGWAGVRPEQHKRPRRRGEQRFLRQGHGQRTGRQHDSWPSESPPRTSEARPMPAAFSSSPPLEPP